MLNIKSASWVVLSSLSKRLPLIRSCFSKKVKQVVGWFAFVGGIHFTAASFLSLTGASLSSLELGGSFPCSWLRVTAGKISSSIVSPFGFIRDLSLPVLILSVDVIYLVLGDIRCFGICLFFFCVSI